MFVPKGFKFSKFHKGRLTYIPKSQQLTWGKYGILSLQSVRLSLSTLVSIQRVVQSFMKPHGLYWFRVFPHLPVTSKPIEVRMGKGKGSFSYWMTRISAGSILIEFTCNSPLIAKKVYKIVNSKLPVKSKLIFKNPHS